MMKSQRKVALYIFISIYILIFDLVGEPRLQADDFFVSVGKERSLSEDEWLFLALAASGSDEESIERHFQEINHFIEELPGKIPLAGDQKQKGEQLLQYLHENVFSRYSLHQTKIGELWDTGYYNCVSSAVFYSLCGRSLGLTIGAVRTPDHAFCLLGTEEGAVDVETTSPYGVDPGKEFEIEFAESTGFAYVPPGNYTQRQEITLRSLTGLIIQNRISFLQSRNDYATGVGLAVDRVAFDPSLNAIYEREKAFANYAAWLNGRREYEKGLVFLKQLGVLYPDPGKSRSELVETFVNNQMIAFLGEDNYEQAAILLNDSLSRSYLNENTLTEYRSEIVNRKLYNEVNFLDFSDARMAIEFAFDSSLISRDNRNELIVFSFNRKVSQLYQQEAGYKAAYFLYISLDDELKKIPDMKSIEQVILKNFEYSFHNDFSEVFNSRNYSEARAILDAGLQYFPGSELLKKDYKLLP